ncbi:FAD-linked oxidase C-terminal domain-containing protein [Microvirga flavescens]|uniref:FAD-linked oxidase C-terminal domain-containing protein n=1 Tax=Microvirga flavescens TaxID=2249811 RepID=UPI000DD5CAB3|nr:FAD-linked oxidase C-terminal domain-containing protein [Microvirga flavescens]
MGIAFPQPDQAILARREEILAGLARLVAPEALIVTEDERRAFETDGLTAYRQMPLAVVLPSTTAEVSAVMRFCHENGVKVVPRGAGTSLCGGAIPQQDAIVLGIAKMNRVLHIDFANRTARVEAGITNLAISQAVAYEGFFYAPDPSSQLACTIAGNIAMNSGGAHCLKYGVTTNNLLGVTMVLLDGTVVTLGGEHLDSAGYDLLGLITGSEGQLGIVTEAVVRILRAAEGARPALLGFDSVEDAGACVAAIIGAGIIPVALEYMDRPAIKICEAFAHAGYPLDVEAMLIVEVEGSDAEIDDMLRRIVAIAEPFKPKTVKVSQSEAESAAIWKGRKSAFGATGRVADYICMDGTIPTGQLPQVLKRIDEIAKAHGLGVANVFHAGDGNLHPLVMFDTSKPGEMEKAEIVGEEILKLCVEVGGCLTGEHGVGIEKRDLMTFQFNEADLVQQMRVRGVFDPLWLLNPAKVFPLQGRLAA